MNGNFKTFSLNRTFILYKTHIVIKSKRKTKQRASACVMATMETDNNNYGKDNLEGSRRLAMPYTVSTYADNTVDANNADCMMIMTATASLAYVADPARVYEGPLRFQPSLAISQRSVWRYRLRRCPCYSRLLVFSPAAPSGPPSCSRRYPARLRPDSIRSRKKRPLRRDWNPIGLDDRCDTCACVATDPSRGNPSRKDCYWSSTSWCSGSVKVTQTRVVPLDAITVKKPRGYFMSLSNITFLNV